MADLTLYTIADPEILAGALRGIAMVFDPSATQVWVSNGGLGLGAIAGVGLLITLMITLFKAIMTQKLELWTFLIMMVVYTMAFVPKTTLQVERIQDGQIEMVDGIPYGVALPAAFMSGMMKAVSDTFELAFSDPAVGTYSETGFMDPLKTLMGMRNLLGTAGGNGHLKANFIAYAQKCMVDSGTGEEVDFTEALRNAGSMDVLFDPAKIKGGVVTLVQPTPNGYMQGQYSCTEAVDTMPAAATLLRQQVTTYISPTDATKPIGLEADLRQTIGTKPYVGTSAKEELERSITMLAGSAIVNQDVAIEDLVIGSLIRESGKYASIQDPTRLAQTMEMTRAMEAWKVDSSASGSMFLATMQSSMDIMLFVWIALAPILAMTMIISGLAGLKMLAQFFLFGIWTQSWMPFAMVINYYMQLTVSGKLESKLMPGGDIQSLFAVGYQDALYNEIGTSIATASQLLAFTPVLSLAILTGSYMALTNLGTAMSGKDGYFDEKKLAADGGVATGGQNIANQNHNLGYNATQSAGIASGAGSANLAYTHAGAGVLSSQTVSSSAEGIQTQAQKTATAAASAGFERMFGLNTQHMQSWRKVVESSMRDSTGLSDTKMNETLKQLGVEDTQGMDSQSKLDLITQLSGILRFGGRGAAQGSTPGKPGTGGSLLSKVVGLFGEAGLSLGATSQTGTSDAYKKALATGIKNSWNDKNAHALVNDKVASRGNSQSVEDTASLTEAANESSRYGDTYTTSRALAETAANTVNRMRSAGVNHTQTFPQLAQQAAARNAVERRGSGGKIQGDQVQQLQAAAMADQWGEDGAAAMATFREAAKKGDWSSVGDSIRMLMTSGKASDRAMGYAMAAEYIQMAGGPKDLADQYRSQAGLERDFAATYEARMKDGQDAKAEVGDKSASIQKDVDANSANVEAKQKKAKKARTAGTSEKTYQSNAGTVAAPYAATAEATLGAGEAAVANANGKNLLTYSQRMNAHSSAAPHNLLESLDNLGGSFFDRLSGLVAGEHGTATMDAAQKMIAGVNTLISSGQQITAFAQEAQRAGGFDKLSPQRQQEITATLDQYTSAYEGTKGGIFGRDGGTSAGDFNGNQGARLAGVAAHFKNNQGEYRQDLLNANREFDRGAHWQGSGDTQLQRGERRAKVSPLATPGENFLFEFGAQGRQRGTDGTPSQYNVDAVGSGEHMDHQDEDPQPPLYLRKHFPNQEQ